MSGPASRKAPSLAVIAPDEVVWPEEADLWIVDLQGLGQAAAEARAAASLEACRRRGAGTCLLNPPPSLAPRGVRDLGGILRSEVDGLSFRISLPALIRYVPPMRRFVAVRVGESWGERAAFGMELVLDELCLNAIEHGSPHPSRFEVAVWTERAVLHYRISNAHPAGEEPGRALNRRLRDFDASGAYLEERGRGLFLVARIVDGLKVEGRDGQVRVHVWKDLRRAPG